MSERQDKLQRLENISQSYQVDGEVASKAIKQIEGEKMQKSAKRKPFLKFAYSAVAMICIVAIGLAVYFGTRPAPIVYFDDAELEHQKVEQIVEESVFTFDQTGSTNWISTVKETHKVAYVKQEVFFSEFWDNVLLYAVVLDNADFDFESDYSDCEFEYEYNNVKISYIKALTPNAFGGEGAKIEAKFTYQKHDYFMTIESFGDVEPTAKIAHYVDLLINN